LIATGIEQFGHDVAERAPPEGWAIVREREQLRWGGKRKEKVTYLISK
jgi:hypothetical protein